MIDEIKEYQELLVDRIAKGNYCSSSKDSYIIKIKANDKRVNPPSNSLLILRHFLFDGINNDWSDITLEERKGRIEKAKIALLCWLGDKESYKTGNELLKEEFKTLVKENEGAYEMLCNTYKDAIKLKENRLRVIDGLKTKKDFFNKLYIPTFKDYTIDALIYDAIALGPLKHNIIAFKKSEIKEMFDTIIQYHYVCNCALDVRRNNWYKTLLFTCYLVAYQTNHNDGDMSAFVDVDNVSIVTLLQSDKCLKMNGKKDLRYNIKLLAAQPIDSDKRNEDNMVDYAFGFYENQEDGLNNLWRPNPNIARFIEIYDDEKDINEEEYIYFTNMTGPDFLDSFKEKLEPYIE